MWKNQCSKELSEPINNNSIYDYYNNLEYKITEVRAMTEPNANEIIELYKIENLIKKQEKSNNFTNFIKSINECYTVSDNKKLTPNDFTNFINNSSIKNNFRTDILYPGICYNGEYTITSPNGNFSLKCGGTKYNLSLYYKKDLQPIWSIPISSGDSGNNNVCMFNDGDLVIYKKGYTNNFSSNGIWRTKTEDTDHKDRDAHGSYCQLLDNGLFVIKNKDGYINLSGNMEQIISDIGKGYNNLTGKYLQFKGGDEIYFKDSSKIYQYFSYSNGFTWTNGDINFKIWDDGDLAIYILKNNIRTNIWKYSWTPSDWVVNSTLTMQTDGNLVLDDPDGNSIYSSRTYGNGPGTYAKLENGDFKSPYKGHVIIFSKDNKRVGSLSKYRLDNVKKYYNNVQLEYYPHLKGDDEFLLQEKDKIIPLLRYSMGFTFTSDKNNDGKYYSLVMQDDGNLVLYYHQPGTNRLVIGSSSSDGNKNATLTYQQNNNLAIDKVNEDGDITDEIDDTGIKDWGYITIQEDGNVVWYRESDRKVFWTSGTAKKTTRQGKIFF